MQAFIVSSSSLLPSSLHQDLASFLALRLAEFLFPFPFLPCLPFLPFLPLLPPLLFLLPPLFPPLLPPALRSHSVPSGVSPLPGSDQSVFLQFEAFCLRPLRPPLLPPLLFFLPPLLFLLPPLLPPPC